MLIDFVIPTIRVSSSIALCLICLSGGEDTLYNFLLILGHASNFQRSIHQVELRLVLVLVGRRALHLIASRNVDLRADFSQVCDAV